MQLKFLIYLQKFEVFKRIEADTKWALFYRLSFVFLNENIRISIQTSLNFYPKN